jgi:Ca-activated chloride channel homolog
MTGAGARREGKSPRMSSSVLSLASLVLLAAAGAPAPAFRLQVPDGMAVGRVALRAETADPRVASVSWTVDDTTRTLPPPFTLVLDVGPVPQEKRVLAVALDRDRKALYRKEVILNPGERALHLEILSPLEGERVSGSVTVLVRSAVPPGDALESVTVEAGGRSVTLAGDGDNLSAVVEVADRTVPLSVNLRTVDGRRAERTIVLNGHGVLASSEAHIVEQMVAVTRGGEPLEGLTAADFKVRDGAGACEVRDVTLLKDTPLAVGILVDTSESLLYTEALRQATAGLFLERTVKERDRAFLTRFGPGVSKVVDWTRSKEALRQAILALPDDEIPGTLLYSGIVRALYQFQGQQGARALILITDGNAFEDDLGAGQALEYARQSGVKIYALGLPATGHYETIVREKDAEGKSVKRVVLEPVTLPPNLEALQPFAKETGGRVYSVRKADDLPTFYAEIERDIRTQYLVSYVSNAKRKAVFHPVEIRTTRGQVRTAPGFFY